MTRFMKLAALAALVMLVASCCPCRKHRKGDGKPFVGTEWQLVQLTVVPYRWKATLYRRFGEDGRLSGSEPATGLWVPTKPRKQAV